MDQQSYNQAVMAAFSDELEKQAILGAVGRGMMSLGARAAGAMGKNMQWGRMLQKGHKAFGGAKGLQKAVGLGTLAAGGGIVAGSAASRR